MGLPRGVVNAERSAFAEGNERKLLLRFYPSSAAKVPYNELIRIKFEVDTNPPGLFSTEFRPLLLPSPCKVRLYDGPSLFAGKMHALLCRGGVEPSQRPRPLRLFVLSVQGHCTQHATSQGVDRRLALHPAGCEADGGASPGIPGEEVLLP